MKKIIKSMTRTLSILSFIAFVLYLFCGLVQAQGEPVQPTLPGAAHPGVVETPPVPGQVYGPQEPKENEEMQAELPPELQAIDRKIKESTRVLRRSLEGPGDQGPSAGEGHDYSQGYHGERKGLFPSVRESHPKEIVSSVSKGNAEGPDRYERGRPGYNVKKGKSGLVMVKSIPKTERSSRKGVFLTISVILVIGALGLWFLYRQRA